MNENDALDRLNSLLPLASNQQRLPAALRELHRLILQGFAEHGHAPSREAMAERLADVPLDDALQQLAADDLVVLSADRCELTGAYPFTAEERVHAVSLNGHQLHVMFALDALAVAPLTILADMKNELTEFLP